MPLDCLMPERVRPVLPNGELDYSQYIEIWDLEKFSKRALRRGYRRLCAADCGLTRYFAPDTRHNVWMGVKRGFLSIEDAEIILKNIRSVFYRYKPWERKKIKLEDERFLEIQRAKREEQKA